MPYFNFVDVTLALGFNHKGIWYNKVSAREWTGGDNQFLVSAEAQQNIIKGVNTFLASIVNRIYNSDTGEELTKITKDMFADMYSVDRDMIILETRKLTFGTNLPISYTCVNTDCKQQNSFDFDLNTIDIKYAESFPPNTEFYITLEHGIPSPTSINSPEGEEIFKNITLTYLKGRDEERVVQAGKINQAKAEAYIAFASIKDIPGFDMTRKSPGLVDKMKSIDYRDLLNTIVENRIGPNLSVDVVCYNCDQQVTLPLARRLYSTS